MILNQAEYRHTLGKMKAGGVIVAGSGVCKRIRPWTLFNTPIYMHVPRGEVCGGVLLRRNKDGSYIIHLLGNSFLFLIK